MEDPNAAVNAVKAALDWQSTPETRQAATAYLDALESGDVRVLGTVAFVISKEDQPSEVRHHGLKILQHLVRLRWFELNADERHSMTGLVVDMVRDFPQNNEEWALKSQTAALLAEVARREGETVWKEILSALFSLSHTNPVKAEMAALVLRWLPEDVTVHNEDLEDERRRKLLAGLTQSLPEILPFLYKLLEYNFGAVIRASQQQDWQAAKQHAAAVSAGLHALLSYAEWVPVPTISNFGLIEACGFLLNSTDFRLRACEFLKHVVTRRRPVDDTAAMFDTGVTRAFEILSGVAEAYLQHLSSHGSTNAADVEFGECLCESMVAAGSHNLVCIASAEQRLLGYYRQMLCFLQHPKFSIHAQALPLWLTLIREQMEKRVLPADIASSLLDVAFQKLRRKSFEADAIEDEFTTSNEYSQYRARLLDLIKLTATVHPIIAIGKVVQWLDIALGISNSGNITSQDILNLERAQIMLDSVMSGTVSNTSFERTNEFGNIVDGFIQRILCIEWTKAELVDLHAKILDALGPYLNHVPAAVPLFVQKLFSLLNSVPVTNKEFGGRVRLQICTSFLRISKSASSALLPHIEAIASTMTNLEQKGLLLRGEHTLLGEALLMAGSAAGRDQQVQVLEWLLKPFREQWVHSDWQHKYLSSPNGLVQLLTETFPATDKHNSDKQMWHVYHCVTLFEKSIRRCAKADATSPHPMAAHLSWILPPLLQLLRCVHALWSPQVMLTLPETVRNSLAMSACEQASVLGILHGRDEEGNEEEVRNWLKGIRDSGYNIICAGCSRVGNDLYYKLSDNSDAVATCVLENLQTMEYRHFRLLLHLVITPFVKSCPPSLWASWLAALLSPVLKECQQRLCKGWETMLTDGVATLTPSSLFAVSSVNSTEVIQERILRDLTRETCHLLAVIASSELNQSLQSGASEQQHSMLTFLLNMEEAASASLEIAIQSLCWPDTDAVHKGLVFCGAVVNMAAVVENVRLREVVGKNILSAIIQSLTLESNASVQAELVGLIRDILLRIAPHTSAPKQVLLSLPSITEETLTMFEGTFGKTSSAKEQRVHIRNLLLAAGGEQLKALKLLKNTNVITNLTTSNQDRSKQQLHKGGEALPAGQIGLASIL